MSFEVDMTAILQQFINVFGSLSPILWLFMGVLLALFLLGGIVNILKNWVRN